VEFEAKRKTAKYCSKRCSVRATRQRSVAPPNSGPDPVLSGVEAATLAELAAAGRASSAGGLAVLALARRIDLPSAESGSSLASLVREHRASLAAVLESAAPVADPVEDELRAARERRRAVSGG
jgi:hypothetical protein